MDMILHRRWYTERSTVGVLQVGEWTCYVLEDSVHDGPKIPDRTAIPAGRYRVQWTFSPRFNRFLPLLLDVPGFTGIRIHSGNRPEDTQGCLLPGLSHAVGSDWVGLSRIACDYLFPLIVDAQPDCWLTIVDHREESQDEEVQ